MWEVEDVLCVQKALPVVTTDAQGAWNCQEAGVGHERGINTFDHLLTCNSTVFRSLYVTGIVQDTKQGAEKELPDCVVVQYVADYGVTLRKCNVMMTVSCYVDCSWTGSRTR